MKKEISLQKANLKEVEIFISTFNSEDALTTLIHVSCSKLFKIETQNFLREEGEENYFKRA